MWRPTDPQGNESAKIKYELIRYTKGKGIDIGCGPWKVMSHVVGVDNIPYGGEHGNNITSDCLALDFFAPGSMDFVFSSHLLEHIWDTQAALKHWWKLLKNGGYLILYLPHKDLYPNMGQPGANPDHKHDFTPQDIIDAMKSAAPHWDLVDNQTRSQDREYSFFQVFRKSDFGGQKQSWKKDKPAKRCAVVRYGAYGDALWASSILPHLKAEGYHVTVYTSTQGEEVLRHDPHIDELVQVFDYQIPNTEILAFHMYESEKYDRWISLIGSVETRLLPTTLEAPFYWPDEVRRKFMDQNYLEAVHDFAGVPYAFRQKFYPTDEERKWASLERAKYEGPIVVINPTGSSLPKNWPHVHEFMRLMAEQQVHTFLLGDVKSAVTPHDYYGHLICREWDIRKAFAFARLADVVIGTESAIVNSVALENNLKIVLLSHSSANNLVKHWRNTIAIEPKNLGCFPCHRIHQIWNFCTLEKSTTAAACQAAATPAKLAEIVAQYLKIDAEVEAA